MKMKFYALQLVLVCVIIFIIQTIFPGFTDLFVLNKLSFIQPWRFLTAIFLHGSLSHLFYNMFALALFGTLLEGFIGGKRFLIIFFAAGIGANIISVNFYDSALGASGAIYGVIGALMIIRPFLMVWALGLPMPMVLAGILWAIGDFAGIFMPSNVANIAHLIGIFVGLILGFVFKRDFLPKRERNEITLHEDSVRKWEDVYLR